jgi:5-methylcytosine-specific restriction endonuclease McrA
MRQTSNGGCVECHKAVGLRQDTIDKRRATGRAHYQANKSEILAYGKKYREENRDKFAQWTAEWRAKNPERDRATRRASQLRRRAAMTGATTGEVKAWVAEQKKVCYWCAKSCEDEFHVDHYEPLARGGEHEIKNLVIACPPCNLTKKCKDPYQFAASLGRLF